MKTFKKLARQGDVIIRRIDSIPEEARDVTPEDGKLVVAHSETGHHHMVDSLTARLMRGDNPSVCYLVCTETEELVHHRSWHTHESFELRPGNYEFVRARQATPTGWELVSD